MPFDKRTVFMDYLDTYKGVKLYRVHSDVDPAKGKKLIAKIVGHGLHPGWSNLKAEFSAESATEGKALKKIQAKIDRYLEKHDLKNLRPSE